MEFEVHILCVSSTHERSMHMKYEVANGKRPPPISTRLRNLIFETELSVSALPVDPKINLRGGNGRS